MRPWLLLLLLTPGAAAGALAQCPDGTPMPCRAAARAARPAAPPMSVAVLDFENLSRDTTDDYLAEGLAEELSGQLGRVERLVVTSRTMVRRLPGRASMAIPDVGRALNVSYVVVGSVRRSGPRLRISVELLRAATGVRTWSEQFDRTGADLLDIQDAIASAVASAVAGQLLPAERATLAARPTRSPEAWDAYLRGRGLSSDGQMAARELMRAVEIDSAFAPAWAQLAIVHARLFGLYTDRTSERLNLARQAAERARILAPRDHKTHLAQGWVHYYATREYPRAAREFEAALGIQPDDPQIHFSLALVARSQGRWAAAEASLNRAIVLDSIDGALWGQFGLTLLPQRRYAEVRERNAGAFRRGNRGYPVFVDELLAELGARETVQPAPAVLDSVVARAAGLPNGLLTSSGRNFPVLRSFSQIGQAVLGAGMPAAGPDRRAGYHLARTTVLAQLGRTAEAAVEAESLIAVAQVQLRLWPDDDAFHALLAYGYSARGRHSDAIREAERAVALLPVSRDAFTGPDRVQTLAEILVAAGEHERAIDRLAYLLAIPSFLSRWMLTADPVWAPLRGNPRFDRLAAGN